MTADSEMPPRQPGQDASLEQLLTESHGCLGELQTALERLIQQNEKLRGRLAADRRSPTSTAAAPGSCSPENPAAIEQPTALAELVIVTELLPAPDEACGPSWPS